MAVEKTKHQFVDDNPYLVYSGEPESTVDNAGGGGSGGGGGDDSPFLYVTVSEDIGTWIVAGTSLTISENKETIVNAMHNNKIVIFVANLIDSSDNMVYQYFIRANIIVKDPDDNEGVIATFYDFVFGLGFYRIIVDDIGSTGFKIAQD